MDTIKMAADIEAHIVALTRSGKQPSRSQMEWMRSWPQLVADGEPHPWYGPCDGMGPAGACSECAKAGFATEAEWLAWLQAPRVGHLFRSGSFTLHSGEHSTFKIDCDALTDRDFDALADMIGRRVGRFSVAEGVPRGGIRLAAALNRRFAKNDAPVLIVDDVLTTGASMEAHRAGREAKGAVIFARGRCPSWVTPLFTLSADAVDPHVGTSND